jgi:hypothetical protein
MSRGGEGGREGGREGGGGGRMRVCIIMVETTLLLYV